MQDRCYAPGQSSAIRVLPFLASCSCIRSAPPESCKAAHIITMIFFKVLPKAEREELVIDETRPGFVNYPR